MIKKSFNCKSDIAVAKWMDNLLLFTLHNTISHIFVWYVIQPISVQKMASLAVGTYGNWR